MLPCPPVDKTLCRCPENTGDRKKILDRLFKYNERLHFHSPARLVPGLSARLYLAGSVLEGISRGILVIQGLVQCVFCGPGCSSGCPPLSSGALGCSLWSSCGSGCPSWSRVSLPVSSWSMVWLRVSFMV